MVISKSGSEIWKEKARDREREKRRNVDKRNGVCLKYIESVKRKIEPLPCANFSGGGHRKKKSQTRK